MEVDLDREEQPWRRNGPVALEDVALKDIDHDDTIFQFRTASSRRADLGASLEAHGQMRPIAVVAGENGYRIVDGFTRIDAIQKLGWKRIRALIYRGMSDREAKALSYASNATRENLSFADKANAMQDAVREGFTHKEVGKFFGVVPRTIDRYLEIPEVLRDHVDCKVITMGHARALIPLVEQGKNELVEHNLTWIHDTGASVPQLKKKLKDAGVLSHSGRKRRYGAIKNDTVRCYGFQLGPGSSREERQEAILFFRRGIGTLERMDDDASFRESTGA